MKKIVFGGTMDPEDAPYRNSRPIGGGGQLIQFRRLRAEFSVGF